MLHPLDAMIQECAAKLIILNLIADVGTRPCLLHGQRMDLYPPAHGSNGILSFNTSMPVPYPFPMDSLSNTIHTLSKWVHAPIEVFKGIR